MKRKILIAAVIALVSLFAVFAVSCSQQETVVLNVYNWGEYISDGADDSLDVNEAFEEYCAEKGMKVKVNYMMYDSNESMYNKLKTGAVAYDVIIPSDYMIARLINEGMLRELNYQNIPNFKDVDPRYVSPYYDAEQKYSVPYMVGVVGILYNTQYVSEEDIGGWNLMWNEKYKGKILQFNNSRDAFGTAMFKDGQSVNDTSEATWRAALEELKKQKPLLQAYVMDEIFNKMETESAWIAAYYAGDFLAMYEENPNLGFYYPEVGTNIFADAMCVPVNSANPELAEMYINFMLEREIAAANAEYIYYSSPLTTVNSDPEYIEYMESVYEGAVDILSPEFPEGYNLEYYHNFSDTDLQMVNSLWEELKIDSGTEDGSLADTGVYITCAVIVAAIAVGFTVRYIIQRRRRRYY